MFKSSALLASVAIAATTMDNYTGTIADLAGTEHGNLTNVKVAVEVKQVDAQVTYDYTVSGLFADAASANSDVGVGLCYPGAAAD